MASPSIATPIDPLGPFIDPNSRFAPANQPAASERPL
jgi:hypothetical protein